MRHAQFKKFGQAEALVARWRIQWVDRMTPPSCEVFQWRSHTLTTFYSWRICQVREDDGGSSRIAADLVLTSTIVSHSEHLRIVFNLKTVTCMEPHERQSFRTVRDRSGRSGMTGLLCLCLLKPVASSFIHYRSEFTCNKS